MMRIQHLFLCLLLLPVMAVAQPDSVLTFERYLEQVSRNHPLAKRARLQVPTGEAMLRQARGAFDPTVGAMFDQKDFQSKDYWQRLNAGLSIPTWYGVTVKTGYQQNSGDFLNPENSTPDPGQWYTSIVVPVGQGLFIDERRAALKQARVFVALTEAEQRLRLNGLLFEAGSAYWDWARAAYSVTVIQEGLALAQQRFEGVKNEALQGSKPSIDTVEARIQVQNRQLALQESRLDLRNSAARLSVYLWQDGMVPLELDSTTVPPALTALSPAVSSSMALADAVAQHPKLRQQQLKIDQLEVEQRWKREQLKPRLDLEYSPLAEAQSHPLYGYTSNDFKWGVNFSIPLLLRKERASLRLTQIKLQEAGYDLQTAEQMLEFNLLAALNEFQNTTSQLVTSNQQVLDYRQLLQGEQQLFDNGESSLFMVNSREQGYVNSRLKYVKLLTRNHKAALKIRYTRAELE